MKKTKIVSTLGPATNSVEKIVNLIKSGANVFRFNFSHGTHAEHLARIHMVREAEMITHTTVGVMLDTKGAEIRTTVQANDGFAVRAGDQLRISMDSSVIGNQQRIAVTYSGLYDDVKLYNTILIDDGTVGLTVVGKDEAKHELITAVQNNGFIGSQKGVNVPGITINLPSVTPKDRDDIEFGLKYGINFIAASFIRKAQNVLDIRKILEENHQPHVQIFPKIESQEGIDNIDDILSVSDGLMIARGDMGVEIPFEQVPFIQKELIKKCNVLGKPIITATQMLNSMQTNPRPTRAEVTDVANAVLDGTDATMLSGETANGEYPVEAVAAMTKIDEKAETSPIFIAHTHNLLQELYSQSDVTEAIGEAAVRTANNLDIKIIVAFTQTGLTARKIAKYRPQADILALTGDESVQRGLTINWGVHAVYVPNLDAATDTSKLAAQKVQELGLANKGDLILVVAGVLVDGAETTNIMRIQLVDEKLIRGKGIGYGKVKGHVVIAHNAQEALEKVHQDDILITPSTSLDYVPILNKVKAIVVEGNSLTSHAVLTSMEQRLPLIISVKNATKLFNDGSLITLDINHGVIYPGEH